MDRSQTHGYEERSAKTGHIEAPSTSKQELIATRRRHIGPNTALSYDDPLCFVRGQGTYLFDERGTRYLDCVNNVAHVGHSHPEVVAAVTSQLMQLNTNSRYLHPEHVAYTQELLATLPPALQTLYLVCSGSEANDLALRVALAARPGAAHVVVLGGAYHGHTSSLIHLSPYKFWGRGGQGRAPHVHVIPCPDPYRNQYLDGRAAARAAIAQAHAAGGRVALFMCESILSCGGQIVLPEGYLQGIYEEMRREGALVLADEVQCGFGRVGAATWGFQTQGVVPDMVSMGKPIGNGYPMAALALSREAAQAFAASGMEYFNTYGGSTAAVAAGRAVLRVLREERLQQRAAQTGELLLSALRGVKAQHNDIIGDVRGMGLFVGLDIVTDPVSKHYAPVMAKWIKERLKARRVLVSCDGPYDNVIKLKPPMVFGEAEVEAMVASLRSVLAEELTPGVQARIAAEEAEHWRKVCAPIKQRYDENAAELAKHAEKPSVKLPVQAATLPQRQQQAVSHSYGGRHSHGRYVDGDLDAPVVMAAPVSAVVAAADIAGAGGAMLLSRL